jgi:hypothetical protein
MTRDEIDGYFKLKEWQYIKDAENVWHTGFQSRIKSYRRDFEVFVILLEDWLYVRVPLLTVDSQACWPYLTEYLLGLNYQLFLAKIALQGRRVVLTVELPARCSLVDLDEAMRAVDTYVQSYYLDIETMATSINVAEMVHKMIKENFAEEADTVQELAPEIIFNE